MGVEIFGVICSILILVSMCFNPTTRKGNIALRALNLLGSVAFVIYGFLLPAYATILMNSGAIIVNLIYLIKTLKASK